MAEISLINGQENRLIWRKRTITFKKNMFSERVYMFFGWKNMFSQRKNMFSEWKNMFSQRKNMLTGRKNMFSERKNMLTGRKNIHFYEISEQNQP